MGERGAWRPRDGKRIEQGRSPGSIHKFGSRVANKIPPKLLHPVWGIIVATLLALGMPRELMLRSIGLMIVAIWLSLDLWAWLLKRKWKEWAYILGWSAMSLLLIAVMGVMYWWLSEVLADQREQAFRDISIEYVVPKDYNNDPMKSLFTVTNKSSYGLTSKHTLVCSMLFFASKQGLIATEMVFKQKRAGWGVTFGGPYPKIMGGNGPKEIDDLWPITSGGDATTESCFRLDAGPLICADAVITFYYYLDTQPDIRQEKSVRLWTYPLTDGTFQWAYLPIQERQTPCSTVMRPQAPR